MRGGRQRWRMKVDGIYGFEKPKYVVQWRRVDLTL
jgi:hypothetical protein